MPQLELGLSKQSFWPILRLFTSLLLLGAGGILSFFRVPPTVIAMARGFITIFTCTIPIRIFNLTNIIGILRSGGDTKFSLFLDTAALWLSRLHVFT